MDSKIFPFPETISKWLSCRTQIEPIPHHRDTPDWNLGSFWAHPERVLDPIARAACSGFTRQSDKIVQRVVTNVEDDLNSGQWDKKYGNLRKLEELDVGLRIITAELDS